MRFQESLWLSLFVPAFSPGALPSLPPLTFSLPEQQDPLGFLLVMEEQEDGLRGLRLGLVQVLKEGLTPVQPAKSETTV